MASFAKALSKAFTRDKVHLLHIAPYTPTNSVPGMHHMHSTTW